MSQGLVASFLLVHGLITSAIGLGTMSNPAAPAMTLPSWFSWWPGPFGRSWLFEALGLGSGAAVVGGLIWVAAGLALIAGALGWFGLSALTELRVPLLVGGAALSLVALAIYFHPIYVLAVVINLAIVALLWGRLPAGAAT